jgi:hypothetical protein
LANSSPGIGQTSLTQFFALCQPFCFTTGMVFTGSEIGRCHDVGIVTDFGEMAQGGE